MPPVEAEARSARAANSRVAASCWRKAWTAIDARLTLRSGNGGRIGCGPPQQPGSHACIDSASLQSRCSCSWSPARMSEALRARRPRRHPRLPQLPQVHPRRPRRPPARLPQRRLSTRRRPARLRTPPRRPLCPRRIHRRVPHDPARHRARARNPGAPPQPRLRKRCTRPHRLQRPQRPRARPPLRQPRRWI